MELIKLGNSDLEVSRLGFGCCPMGCHGWGKVSEHEFRVAVLAALDAGINFFDTADVYGLGRSEELLGNFLKFRRKEVVIATKFGVRMSKEGKTFYDNSSAWIEKALDSSLSRLRVDHIDLYQVHHLDGKTPIDNIVRVLEKKRKEGKILFYGLSNISLKDICYLVVPEAMVSFQREYSLANRDKEKEIEELVVKKRLSFLSWGSLGQGVLTGKYGVDTVFCSDDRRSRSTYVNFKGENLKRNVNMVEKIKTQFKDKNKTVSQIAIRWILDKFENSVALVGIKSPKQLFDNIGALDWNLEREEMTYLDSISSWF